MNDLLRDFDREAEAVNEQFAQAARASALSGQKRSPEAAARANQLADKQGMPFGVVADNLDEYEQRDRLDELSEVGRRNPALGEFLTDDRRAALAADDIGNLDKLSQAIRGTLRAGQDYGIGGAWRTWSDHVFDWDNIGSGKTGMRAAPQVSYIEEVTRHAIAGWHRGQANTGLLLGQLGVGDETATAVSFSDSERRAQAAERSTEATDQQFANLQKANETDSIWEALGLIARSPRAVGAVTAQSLGLGAPGLAATAATGGMGRLATMTAAGASSGTVEAGATISEVLQDTGIDMTDPAAISAALRNPALMARARDRAAKRGITIGLFDAATAGIAGHFINNARRGVASAAARVGAETATQIAGGSAGELAAQLATGDDLQLGDIIVEGIAELPFAAVETRANYVSARERGQVRWLNEQMGIVSRSAEGTASLQAATEAAAASKLGERSAADLQALVQASGGDGNVYINADQARVLFQSEPTLLAELVGGEDALAEQVASGDVVIPMDRYLAHASRLPPEITRHARMEPDALSAVELEGLDVEALAAEFGGDTTEAAERAAPGQVDARQAVQDDVYGQLIASERYTPAAAEAQAKLWAAAFSRFGAMSGQDPLALYQKYMGGIQSGSQASPLATRRFAGDARMDALLESVRASDYNPGQRQMFGESLTAWLRRNGGVIDEGGELRGMDAGKQRIGLVNSAGMPLDRARELAAEAGYLPGDSDIAQFLEAIDRDLREGNVFSEQQGDRDRQSFEAERQQLLDAIADNPTLSALSPEEFRALTNQQILDALFPDTMDQPGLGLAPRRRSVQPGAGQTVMDGLQRDAQAIADFLEGEAFTSQTNGSVQVPRPVLAHVFNVLQDAEVLGAVVSALPVDVVDFFAGAQLSPENALRDQPMLENMLAGNGGPNVALPVDVAGSLLRVVAGAAAERASLTSGALEGGAAVGAGSGDSVSSAHAANDVTETHAFSIWFGDSKVVDAQGKPLVVYHGSPDARFMGEDATFMSLNDRYGAREGVGVFWFAKDRGTASTYADDRRAFDYQNAESGIIPAYLKLENPLIVDGGGQAWRDAQQRGKTSDVIEEAQAGGYDGVIIRNVRDDYTGFGRGQERRATDTYVVFNSRQIKAAEGNSGAFDPSNPSILYQDALPDNATTEQLRDRIAELEKELRTDGLTGLRNWRAFTEDETLGWSEVASFDLDGLKRVNDTFGHDAGDEMLRQAAGVFLAGERDGVRFYRKGGDEFAMRARDPEVAAALAQEIVDRLESVDVEFVYQGERIEYRGIGAGYGIAQSFEEADQRLNADKQRREAAGLREARAADGAPRRARRVSDRAEGRESDRRGAQPVADASAQDGRRGFVARARQAILGLFQQPDAPRGQIRIFPDRRMEISLFERADRSTFIHESGHFFLEVFRDIAQAEGATDQARADFAALLSWMGVESGDQIGREQHEQFARGFEKYLGTGQAPSPELRGVFGQFKAWILAVYRDLRALNVELTDDVRGVFDRMLASEEEIEAAQVRQGMEPLFTAPAETSALGLTEAQLETYRAMLTEATDEAKADAFRKLLQAHERERARWYKEEKAKVSAEVTAEYEATPAVRALRILSGRKTVDGVEVPEGLQGIKLDKAALVALYGEPYLKRIGRTYAVSGGLHPNEAARVLGFESGEALVLALAQVPDTLARVDAEVETRMRDRYGDPMTDGTLAEVAMDAVHNSHRVRLLEWEMQTLQALAADPEAQPGPAPRREQAPRERAAPTPEAVAARRAAGARRSLEMRQIGEAARRRMAGRTARQIRPGDYLAAERRAAREAAQAAARGDFAAALLAKRQQAFNAAMYRAARDAQDRFEKHARYLRRFTHGNARAAVGKAGHDYLEQVDALLEGLEVKPVSGRQVERRQRLADWVARQEAEGNPINVPAALLADTGLVNIRDMTVADLQGVVDTIRQIEHLARTKNKLRLAGQERDREEVDAEMAASVAESFEAQPERTGDKTWRETAKQRLGNLDVQRLLPTNITRELDGYREGGAVWANIIQPIRDAIFGKVIPETNKMQEAVAALYAKHYTAAEIGNLDAMVFRPEVGDSWSKGRILSLGMNWGSDGNAEAFLTQAHSRLTEEQAVALLGTLDSRDWAFVQDMVDLVNSYWPEIAETQRRRTGLVPPRVDARPFTIYAADGVHVQVRGGYFPLKYDADRSGYGATQQEIDDIYNDLRVGRSARAATKNGHTIERVGSGGKTVALGLDIASAHMRDVIRDIHLGDAVAYVHTVLKGHAFTEAVIAAGKREHLNALQLWLKDVAAGEMGPRSFMESSVRFIRQNTTAAVLAWKASSSLLQVTGLIQTASIIGNRAMLRGVARLMSKSWIGPNSIWNDMRRSSAYMDQRFGKIPDAVQVVANARDGKLKAGHAAMIRWGYIPMARMQMIADGATWLAGELEGLRRFDGDVAKARAYADDLVIRAQSADNFIDKPAVQRGTLDDKHRQSELVKSTTMLLSYMIAKGNVAREKYQATKLTSPLQVAKFTADMVQLFALETIIMALLTNGLPDDEDDDGALDDWLAYIGKEVAFGSLATVPVLSQLGTEGRGYTAQGVLERTYGTLDNATGAWLDGELDWRDGKTAISLAGVVTGIPSSQINLTADALWRVRDGEDVAPIEFLIRAEKPRE